MNPFGFCFPVALLFFVLLLDLIVNFVSNGALENFIRKLGRQLRCFSFHCMKTLDPLVAVDVTSLREPERRHKDLSLNRHRWRENKRVQ